ncbi:hypothetical protein ALC57_03903 [Trachymyrmex cornetzi]|uniref:Uncharacterized protein n=1 Tax=Trachymyrmex cornetzi TaxID=471704 RepID=A0A151JLP5_9HYME|nr:hypothetical protein ALC57_03903 [Trachymyrmex cornetzi]
MIGVNKPRIKVDRCNLKYPTGEKVVILYRVFVKIGIGNYLEEVPMYVAEIDDDCILGVDFLKKLNLLNVFD